MGQSPQNIGGICVVITTALWFDVIIYKVTRKDKTNNMYILYIPIGIGL